MQILQEGPGWVALFKPSGYHVHQPENTLHPVPRDRVMLYLARDFLKTKVYPVHRLDAGTCGVLLMAIDQPSASVLAQQFQNRQVRKVYHAVVRGWTQTEGDIDECLDLDSSGEPVASHTSYRRMARLEVPEPVGRRHQTARSSLVEVEPHTGRFHQIRRHMNRISHPVIGDASHGDSHHNRFYREKLGIAGLCLKAQQLYFKDPQGSERMVEAPDDEKWLRVRSLFANHESALKD